MVESDIVHQNQTWIIDITMSSFDPESTQYILFSWQWQAEWSVKLGSKNGNTLDLEKKQNQKSNIMSADPQKETRNDASVFEFCFFIGVLWWWMNSIMYIALDMDVQVLLTSIAPPFISGKTVLSLQLYSLSIQQ